VDNARARWKSYFFPNVRPLSLALESKGTNSTNTEAGLTLCRSLRYRNYIKNFFCGESYGDGRLTRYGSPRFPRKREIYIRLRPFLLPLKKKGARRAVFQILPS
jgi:hypothetical protein